MISEDPQAWQCPPLTLLNLYTAPQRMPLPLQRLRQPMAREIGLKTHIIRVPPGTCPDHSASDGALREMARTGTTISPVHIALNRISLGAEGPAF